MHSECFPFFTVHMRTKGFMALLDPPLRAAQRQKVLLGIVVLVRKSSTAQVSRQKSLVRSVHASERPFTIKVSSQVPSLNTFWASSELLDLIDLENQKWTL